MGDRGNVGIRENDETVYLYTHWSGSELPETVRAAMNRAKDRWDDAPYLARIVFCEMIKGQESETTGFGIAASLCDNEHDIIVLDVDAQKVEVFGPDGALAEPGELKASMTFEAFAGGRKVPEELEAEPTEAE